MKKLCLLVFLFVFFTSNPYISDSQNAEYYCESFNLFDQWFTEPVESAYFYWADGFTVKFTSYEWNTISVSALIAVWEITRRGYDIKTCLFIIHNHPKPGGFSREDVRFNNSIRKLGFQGMFLLYTSKGVFMLKNNDTN